MSVKELKHMLMLAEKENALKDIKIKALEDYIQALEPKLESGETFDKDYIR